MNVSVPATASPSTAPSPAASSRLPTQAIDASCRWPVLFLFCSGMVWLIAGLLLGLITSIKLHGPGLLADISWLTVGRLRPASVNALLYGFGLQTALGIVLWLICRLGGTTLLNQSVIIFAGALWNFGVTAGIVCILGGQSTGFQWLEMPRWVAFLLFTAYTLIGLWAVITFHYRRERSLYVSQWYLLGAIFWFPWIYSAANYLLAVRPVRGVMQSTVNAWYVSGLLNLWFLPVAFATIYYFLPKLARRPLYSRGMAEFGFWTYALFAGWTGLTQFVGGPFPAWMISISIAFNMLLIVPILCAAINWHCTLAGNYAQLKNSLPLRCVVYAGIAYIAGGLESIALSTRTVSRLTEFTLVGVAWTHLMFFGAFGLAAFGAIYYIVPRLVQREWPSEQGVYRHFLFTVWGVGLYCLALTAGGLVQGLRLNDPTIDFVRAIKSTIPFLGMSTLGLLLILIGQIALAANLYRVVRELCAGCCSSARAWVTAPAVSAAEVKR